MPIAGQKKKKGIDSVLYLRILGRPGRVVQCGIVFD